MTKNDVKWELSNTDKRILALVLVDHKIKDKEIAARLSMDAKYVSKRKKTPALKKEIHKLLMEPIERMRKAKRMAVHKLLELLKSKDTNDVKFAIEKILAAEINVMRTQIDINVEREERYIVQVEHSDGTITTYKANDNETKKIEDTKK